MIDERTILEAMLTSTSEQCRAAGELFLALADRPRDIHFTAEIQRRLDDLPSRPESSVAKALACAKARLAAVEGDLWRIGWHPVQLLAELKRAGYRGVSGQEPPALADLIEMHDALSAAGFLHLATHNDGARG